MVVMLVFYAIMAGVYTFGKQVTLYAQPFFLTGIRITTGGICFLLYQFLFDRKNFFIKKEWIPLLAGYSLAVFVMDNFRLLGLQNIPSSNAAIIATTSPFIAAVLCYWWFNEKFTTTKIVALFCGVTGVFPLLIRHLSKPEASLKIMLFSYGAVFISTIALVFGGIFSKTLIQEKKAPFFMTVGTVMTGGGILGFIVSFCFDTWNPLPVTHMVPAFKLIAFLIATHSFIAYPLYNYLVQRYPVTLVAFAQLSTPFFTAILSWLFFDEAIGWPFFISLFVLSCAFSLFYYEELRQGLIKKNDIL